MKNLAIIPARSGSKGLPDKNIKLLNGHPLMWYSIKAALESGCFDEVMVSTDSMEYAEIAKESGAAVPFLRSAEMSRDDISTWDAVREVLTNYQEQGRMFDTVMLLQPTSPLRTAEDIVNAYNMLKQKNARSIVGMCEVEHSPLWSNNLPSNRSLECFIRPEIAEISCRQKLPIFYRINGAIYLHKLNYDNLKFDLYSSDGFAYIMPQQKSIDIDTELDFIMAESIMKYDLDKK